jgi:citrate synthase
MLTSEEAARRLGVKVSTLYAYVSRGLLVSQPDPVRRGSLFDLDQVGAGGRRPLGWPPSRRA